MSARTPGVIDIAGVTSAPNVYGTTTIGTEQANLATYDPALKRIRNMTPRERMRGTRVMQDGKPDPDAQLKSLQDAATAQRADQQADAMGPFAGLGRRRR